MVQKRTPRGVLLHDAPDHESRWVATRRLLFGDEWIEPGQEVPSEPGRNYAGLYRHGHIAPYVPLKEKSR